MRFSKENRSGEIVPIYDKEGRLSALNFKKGELAVVKNLRFDPSGINREESVVAFSY